MAVRIHSILIIIIGFNVTYVFLTKPRITPDYSEYIIHSADNFTLTCHGDLPLQWTYPNPQLPHDPQFQITSYDNETSLYVTTLHISNATAWDVGFYVCSFLGEESNTSIYIYVDDDEQLMALGNHTGEVVRGKLYTPLVIPCRPSSPDVIVDLYEAGDEDPWKKVRLDIRNPKDRSFWSFDPARGFQLTVATEYQSVLYRCTYRKGSIELEQNIITLVNKIYNSIPQPTIEIIRKGDYTTEGDLLFLLCIIQLEESRFIRNSWYKNDQKLQNNSRVMITDIYSTNTNVYYADLKINDVRKEDEGEYTCKVADDDHNEGISFPFLVSLLAQGQYFLNLSEENNVHSISVRSGEPEVKWRIDIRAHPAADITWYDNRHKKIPLISEKYKITNTTKETVLTILGVTITDRGNYTLRAMNEHEQKALSLFLDVTDKPTVTLNTNKFHLVNKNDSAKCSVAGYPEPEIFWEYKPCQDDSCKYEPIPTPPYYKTGLIVTSRISISASQSGYVKCFANNSLGSDESIVSYIVSDVENGFNTWATENGEMLTHQETRNAKMAIDDQVTFYCAAAEQNYSSNINWYYNDNLITSNDYYLTERSHTEFSNKISFSVKALKYNDSGTYTCKVEEKSNGIIIENKYKEDHVILEVTDPMPPRIINTNLDEDLTNLYIPYQKELFCVASGIPKPKVSWYKDDKDFIPDDKRIVLKDGDRRIFFNHTEGLDEGEYTCKAENLMGKVSITGRIKFKNFTQLNPVYIIVVIAGFLILVIGCGGALYYKTRQEKKLEKELRLAGLANFEKGAVESLNPELGIDDQAELLPYDKDTWEIPRERLKLGKQLGSGAFGVVMKAEAEGIVEGEDSTTVAVKMVKKNADYTYIKALASELKIMVHLGKHLNVVNLIGACTKNVVKRELLVVVEYCRFGNLHNYLLRHRENFIDQIDPKSGKIDYNIGAEILERSFSISSSRSNNSNQNTLKYVELSFPNSHDGPPKDMMDYRGNVSYSGVTQNTDTTTVCMTPTGGPGDEPLTSSNSIQPEWRSNYRGDYNKGNVKPICTKDLLTWAFQVARGMEYLASRKVLHGDLAARNILLADNNIVKICDFGLAKSMYNNDNYKKKGDGPLPIKWMSVEAIRDRVFSTQSDVWSFGIVLWEFFSLARTPYPGMEVDERLYQKLVEGYRMDIPQYATHDVYEMMKDCWEPKPLRRPTFTKLATRIGSMLEDTVTKHYIDLNDPYLMMNTQRFNEGHSDYLQMVSPPDFQNLSSPHHYVNENVALSPNGVDQSSYLFMKPADIFSPRERDNEIFTFGEVARKHKEIEPEVTSPELIPMLNVQADSDYDSSSQHNSPKGPAIPSFSNPSYHHLPVVATPKDIVKSADNYVNMPQNKSAIRNERNNDTDKNIKDPHYINSTTRDWENVTKV